MRKILTFFFISIFLSLVASAQDQPSSFQIRMWDNSLFSTVFGSDDTGRFQRAYNVRSIEGGEYFLRVTKRNDSDLEVLFEGHIEIPAGSRVQAVLLEDGGLEVSVLEDIQRTNTPFDLKSKVQGLQSRTRTGTNAGEPIGGQLIEPLDFTDLKNEMLDARTDQERESIGSSGLLQNLFTTSYVVELAKVFRDETFRLGFVKSAYTRVIDPEQYFVVRKLFEEEENKDLLDEYMEKNVNRVQQRKPQDLFK